jgi:hypothetical protein
MMDSVKIRLTQPQDELELGLTLATLSIVGFLPDEANTGDK